MTVVVTQKPSTLTELEDLFIRVRPALSEDQERVARHALMNPQVVAFGAAETLAGRCGVSPSTVLRLTNSLGLDGYRELKKIFH